MSETGKRQKSNRGPAAAAHNRRALIDAARDLFADEGFGVPFSAVARRAGVGQASLYRHFPDKVALGVAVFEENLVQLEREELRLRDLFDRIAEQARVSASLLEALVASRSPLALDLNARLRSLIAGILERERTDGRVDPAVDVNDVVTAVSMIAVHVASSPDADATTRAIRLVERGVLPRPI